MNAPGKILIADRNRHVREFLRRELLAEGYQVEEARDGREILERVNGPTPPDLLILDPEMPFVAELKILESLHELQPSLPVVIHSFHPESEQNLPGGVAFLVKREDTHLLKEVVAELLRGNNHPHPQAAQD